MPRKRQNLHSGGIIHILLIWLIALLNTGSASAAPDPPPEPDRFTSITVDYTLYKWWLLRWANSDIVCEINIEHEGLPTLGEIYVDCGESLYASWIKQDACPAHLFKDDPTLCPGYYLHHFSSFPKEREVAIALPPPVVWITLDDCITESTTNRCARPPMLALRGDEPLSGEKIIAINGELDGEPFTCTSAACELSLSETDEDGVDLLFWAYSSYGDSSHIFDARVRVIHAKDEDNDSFWYVDVLSPQ